jgi:outer membrane protein OmpA-like peptidoglycan-associated protein
MINKRFFTLLMAVIALLASGTAYAAVDDELTIGTTKPDVTVTLDRTIAEGKALVSVEDASKQPLLGLGIDDFTVREGSKSGRVVSVQSIAETKDVPVNIVMVLDNSYSMYERNAIKAVLSGIEKVLKVVRPIDQVHMVVFDNKLTTKAANRNLHVQTFKSSNPEELRAFAKKAYSQQGLTATTVLYEGMLAGLDIVGKLPAADPRIMIVFSDGEDLNSACKSEDVVNATAGTGRFNAYAIDYMPGAKTNRFLTSFATQNRGQIWKATSEEHLVSIFESVATTLDHSYILTYVFSPQPVVMVFDEVALFDFDKAELKPAGKMQIRAYKEKAKAELSRADKIIISGHTDNSGSADYNMKLSQRRAEAVRDYLISIGADQNKIEVIGEGLNRPIADNRTKEGRAKNRRVEVELHGIKKTD